MDTKGINMREDSGKLLELISKNEYSVKEELYMIKKIVEGEEFEYITKDNRRFKAKISSGGNLALLSLKIVGKW